MTDTIGGSIQSVSWFGREFRVTADAGGDRDLGGFTTEFESNGDESGRFIMTRKGWRFEGLALEINDDRGDQEFLQGKVDSRQSGPFSAVEASGAVYQGVGKLVGDLKKATMNSTAAIAFAGPGKLTKQ
jgi:hypothetical protein